MSQDEHAQKYKSLEAHKLNWDNNMLKISDIQFDLRMETLRLIGRSGVALDTLKGVMPASQINNCFTKKKLEAIRRKAEEFEQNVYSTNEDMDEQGTPWDGNPPDLPEFETLTVVEQDAVIQKWKDGEKFILEWKVIFESLQNDWVLLKAELEKSMNTCDEMVDIYGSFMRSLVHNQFY
ncbi:hypothetical protein Ocin01_07608 [Orchesella cincta]|uniref:Uncharacterized protein n=1 Tax=Orchesella cincta TaxID=48709 RepID=A0A1D2N1J3_ORCCI|nr:hypothetical protein Ocin01_07608 [Orchesella cincta]